MDELQNQTGSKTDCKSGWTDYEKKKIAAIVWPMVEMQKAYGRDFNAKLIMQGWEGVLSEKYNGDQICYALKKYALSGGDDFPSPKNINDILDPPKPKITFIEYKEALEYQRNNGWPRFSSEAMLIEDYKKQHETDHNHIGSEYNKDFLKISGQSVKNIK